MPDINKRSILPTLFAGLLLLTAFSGIIPRVISTFAQNSSRPGEGKDMLVLKRVRILDEMGFDRPVEAMSFLVPQGWSVEGSVQWKNVGGCRAEIVSTPITMKSPDGAIQFSVFPVRSFVYSQDQMMMQVLNTASRQGGCQVNAPFNASQYLQNVARSQFGASVSNIRRDESLQPVLDQISASGNAAARQYGTNSTTSGSAVFGTLSWSDGNKGLMQVGVMVMGSPETYAGASNAFASTTVFFQAGMRYPAAREAEALRLYGMISSSNRINPIWSQAKEAFLTRVGNADHAGSMERIRLAGEQSRAYARSQSAAADARMRDWEQRQTSSSYSTSSSSDEGQKRFIQTIREVETWKDNEGHPVELSAGYNYGWSKPDGSIILTNNSIYNPAVEQQENWTRMQKPDR